MKVQKLNEAYDYPEATNPGRGNCAPTAFDYTHWIKQALDHMGDPKFEVIADTQLKDCAKSLLDCKQEFENFNAYWNERFPAMIDFLDKQLAMIPREIIAGSAPDVVEEDLSDRIRKGTLDSNDAGDTFGAEEDGVQIELQDRERHTHEMRTGVNRWGRKYIDGQYNKQPRVATQTWGRVWDKNSGEFKQFEGPKYQVRAEMAKYLDSKK